ncbi:MlaD family protein [Oceanibacterium hippocampi]|uniref:Mce related protein n=1 Tax=Oceanibacterium hippocampi TaxID=745714 RepID=A0A1Y5SE62_9PROT|nr:MlaD family protein [Oceanibacterium hippocampi]SLN37586.1 mce related protein [Oceanibacterium hippocampi]
METKASHVLIGGFVLLFVAGIFGFTLWAAKIEIDQEFVYYDIPLTGSVNGLKIGSDVRYRGITIGSVQDIQIDPDDPSRVLVLAELRSDFPIREGDAATLQMQGITGVAVINIDGARAGNPPIEPPSGKKRAVIPSKPSQLERLFQSAPDLISGGVELVDRVSQLVDENNRQAITEIIVNIRDLTGAVSERREQIGNILDQFEASGADVSETLANLREASGKVSTIIDQLDETLVLARGAITGVDGVVRNDAAKALGEFRATMVGAQKTLATFDAMLAENREPIHDFTSDGLSEFTRFVEEARQLVASLERVSERIESDPARFLFGTQESEFRAE